jgi:anti-sigma factor RsiW
VNCDAFHSALNEYFHGTPSAADRAEVERHAKGCKPCGDRLRVAKELSCRDFVSFLNEYIEDELPPPRRAVFDRHLAICPDCTAYIDSYRKTITLSRRALKGGAPALEEIPEELLKAILAARKAK